MADRPQEKVAIGTGRKGGELSRFTGQIGGE